MKYIVYLTTNNKSICNGAKKIYIGVHKTINPEIFDGYIGCGVLKQKASTYMHPKTPFQYAVKKYGVDAFERQILFIYDSYDEAFKKEAELVNLEFINLPYTYNVALGGLGGSLYKQDPRWHAKPLYQYDLKGNLVNIWENTIDACDFYGFSPNKFGWACVDHVEFLDFFWSRENSIDVNTYTKGKKQFTYLYSKEGKLLDEFTSRTECANFLKSKPQSVSNAISSQTTLYGYYISDKIVDEFIPKARKQLQNEIIYLYDINNKFYGTFKGKEIFPIINMYSFGKLNSAFNDLKGWYKNFYMSLEPIEKVPNKVLNEKKKVDIYKKDGTFIETLNSLKEVKEKYNINSSELNRVLKGIKEHQNYIFKYSK